MELYYMSSKDNNQWVRSISDMLAPASFVIQTELYCEFLINNNLDYNHHLVLANAFWYNVCQENQVELYYTPWNDQHYHHNHPWWQWRWRQIKIVLSNLSSNWSRSSNVDSIIHMHITGPHNSNTNQRPGLLPSSLNWLLLPGIIGLMELDINSVFIQH